MITTLKSLQDKFKDADFKAQFEADYREVYNLAPDADLNIDYNSSNLLDTYYGALELFFNRNHQRLPKYARLPFNEETFKIDTNSRTIKIPADFSKNGIGIVGDHLAEFLWFEADRFYDVVDLMTCNIDLSWHNISAQVIDDEVYQATLFGTYCDDEKIYFAWYVTKNMSSLAGSIEFSVRFYRTAVVNEQQETEFSLYIQPAKLTVKPGMNTSTTVRLDDNFESIIRNRPIYSQLLNSLDAAEPSISIDWNPRADYDLVYDSVTEQYYIDFTVRATSPDNLGLTLFKDEETGKIKARNANDEVVDPNALLIYKWYWEDNTLLQSGVAPADIQFDANVQPLIQIIDDPDGCGYSTLRTNVPGKYNVYVGNEVVKEGNNNYGGIRYRISDPARLTTANDVHYIEPNWIPNVFIDPAVDLALEVDYSDPAPNGAVTCVWYKNNEVLRTDNITAQNPIATLHIADNSGVGAYRAEIQNKKNLMIKSAAPQQTVNVYAIPTTIARDDITMVQNNNSNTVTITLAHTSPNPVVDYLYDLSIRPYGQDNRIRLANDVHVAFANGAAQSFTIDIGEKITDENLKAIGALYTVVLDITEVGCYGKNEVRYVHNSSDEVVYTTKQLDNFIIVAQQ